METQRSNTLMLLFVRLLCRLKTLLVYDITLSSVSKAGICLMNWCKSVEWLHVRLQTLDLSPFHSTLASNIHLHQNKTPLFLNQCLYKTNISKYSYIYPVRSWVYSLFALSISLSVNVICICSWCYLLYVSF